MIHDTSTGRRGLLIAFEGIDGTGKTTQIARLAQWLVGQGVVSLLTREPTDGVYGRKIRELFVDRRRVSREEELALFMDDRREHVAQVILPALARGEVVLTDRYYFSTAAYQGAAGLDSARIIADNEVFAPVPDLVILLTLTPAESVHRIRTLRGEALNDFEQEETLGRVDEVFAGLDRDFIHRVNAADSADQVHAQVRGRVEATLGDAIKVLCV
ncbi:MAG: dTMP kinase [Proteobacteria bacterium]|nr:dTMP kinase [Pseudomonadota bacterium]MBU1687279.1 dTMP kinase [Pseudomonadota bacterium]